MTVPLAINADSLGTWFMEALARVDSPGGGLRGLPRGPGTHDLPAQGRQGDGGRDLECGSGPGLPLRAARNHDLPPGLFTRLPRRAAWRRSDAGQPGKATVVDFDRKDQTQNRFFREFTGKPLRAPRHYIPTTADYARAILLGLGWGLCRTASAWKRSAGRPGRVRPGPGDRDAAHWQRWTLESPLLEVLTEAVKGSQQGRCTPGTRN